MENKYIVQPGDTLCAIARKYGCSVAQLCRMNKIMCADWIEVGQVLTIPTPKQIRRFDITEAIIGFIGGIFSLVVIIAIGILIFKGIKSVITYIKEYKPPVCHYEYVDYNGNTGIAQECLSRYGTLYCGNSSEAFKVNSVKKVCE